MDLDIRQFYKGFFDEADELLAEMEQLLLGLDLESPDSEHLNAIFRAAHSIKGGAATFAFVAITETTHLLENLLDRARHNELQLTTVLMDAFFETKDVLQKLLSSQREDVNPTPAMYVGMCNKLRQIAAEVGDGKKAAIVQQVIKPIPAAITNGEHTLKINFSKLSEVDRKSLSDEMENLGTVIEQTQTDDGMLVRLRTTCDIDDVIAVCCFIIETNQMLVVVEMDHPLEAEDPAIFLTDALDAPVPDVAKIESQTSSNPGAAGAKETGSIRVDVNKVDQIINLVGELVITQSMLSQTALTLDPVIHDRLLRGMGHLERNAKDLQDSVMSIRMMPMDYVFSRYPRLIRDLSAKLGKQVEIVMIGKETALDKGLIERIIDPITHLVRNSLDHGIEGPDERVAAGKSPIGKLTLSAQHVGGSIVIEVRDDGAGLVREKILAKAIKQGLPIGDSATDDEVWQLIFAPGFSTAEVVTDISGRGVGMDVVKRNIYEMGGRVEISSKKGQGTTIKIILPLTLAILNGMSVQVGSEIYILPLNYVIESLQPLLKDIHTINNDETIIHVRGEYLSLVEIHKIFKIENAVSDVTQGIAVIVQAEGKRFALQVDRLVGQHQVVVKNLETNYRKVPGISAATILGDGNVALILDVAAMQYQS